MAEVLSNQGPEAADRPARSRPDRILLVAERVARRGGFMRFERLARVLGEIVCAVRDPAAGTLTSTLPVISWEEAAASQWDLTMVPGAGFLLPETVEGLAAFKDERFGIRMQHILNDQTRRQRFFAVNRAFRPHLVVFNNLDWPVGSFKDLSAERFHTVLGGVDLERFPYRRRQARQSGERWVIGALSKKNPLPLIAALDHLPEHACLRLFGQDQQGLDQQFSALIDAGRLELLGVLDDDALPDYYAGVDCIVSTETFAGWSNLCAEAMASGAPVVCTPQGTGAFARDGETALVVPEPEPAALADRLDRLMTAPEQAADMARAARTAIEPFSWETYARNLMAIAYRDGHSHYAAAPELGLFGKWPMADRLHDVEPLFKNAAGARVIDFGGAEGTIAHAFLSHGAGLMRSLELEQGRVEFSKRLCAAWPQAEFRQADLSDWDGLLARHGDWLAERYDIVLYLGIHHHLPAGMRMRLLGRVLDLAERYLAVRTPPRTWQTDPIMEMITAKGFRPLADPRDPGRRIGVARLFERG